ncbi:MAG: ribose 5-phosphate isomerase A [Rhodospirillales bacterium]|nr:ribose 5-phosphate isomerase A [Rhodospirillales bacterium]MCB9972992.1 ribose 5-phosphate isomerase A [Rhodospirillales bacterium]MCB9980020.1 ribose 5-phosphate isomerase A [Rhodospirillales bacterium]
MKWQNDIAQNLSWSQEISNYDEKLAVARKVAQNVKNGDVIGAGSGSTSFLALKEISRRIKEEGISCKIVPTSREIEISAGVLGVPVTSLLIDQPDWCYDGADEVDPHGNMIKGRGGAMYREKLIMSSTLSHPNGKIFILVDQSKFVDKLGAKFAVPVEIDQESLHYVETELKGLGASDVKFRLAKSKDGPVVTESKHFILDARFHEIGATLEHDIKQITGVIECGLFWGYQPEILTT